MKKKYLSVSEQKSLNGSAYARTSGDGWSAPILILNILPINRQTGGDLNFLRVQ